MRFPNQIRIDASLQITEQEDNQKRDTQQDETNNDDEFSQEFITLVKRYETVSKMNYKKM